MEQRFVVHLNWLLVPNEVVGFNLCRKETDRTMPQMRNDTLSIVIVALAVYVSYDQYNTQIGF